MTYPLSSSVTAGDATLADHYNNLRLDGLYLGQAAADAVPLGTALERYETRLELEKLSAAAVRVPASASAPVSLIIDGFLCQAIANVDLAVGEAPAGAAAVYYVFANRTGASTTFTLTVDTVSTELDNQRRIGRFYWDGSAIVKDSVRSELAGYISDLIYYVDPQICDGRLSLSTGVPVTISDISSSATVYFMPYLGNRVALYVNDYGWRVYEFSELTLDISGVADDANIDVWLYDNEGTLTLAYTTWSNLTLRATALTRQNGVLVKSGSPSYRYLGSVKTSGAGVSADTLQKMFVWNYHNQVPRLMKFADATDNWGYFTDTWRQMRATPANKVEFIIGVSEKPVRANNTLTTRCYDNLVAYIGIGLDSITAPVASPDSNIGELRISPASAYNWQASTCLYSGFPGIGYHYLAPLEKGLNIYGWGNGKQLFEGVIYA